MRGWLAIALYFALVYAAPVPLTHQSKSRQQVLARQDPQPSSSNNSTSTPTSTDGQPKLVIAHHMVGNTYPYTKPDWANDIALASSAGIDAFALNVGSDPWQPDRVKDAYDAAAESGTGFKR